MSDGYDTPSGHDYGCEELPPGHPDGCTCKRALRRLAAAGEQKPLWLYEDDLPDGYPYDAMYEHSEVRNGVRMFPVYAAPQPAPGWNEEGRAAIIRLLWEKQFEKSPWAGKFHLIRHDSLEADYGALADKIVKALRSSQSTSDAGGGVMDFTPEQIAAAQQAIQRHPFFSGNSVTAFGFANVAAKALSKPAAADSNASAEALLREAFDKRCYTLSESHLSGWRLILGFNTLNEVQDAHEALYAHPNASDCEKQGEPTKSEGEKS